MTKRMTFERSYEASVEALWELWTTKEGFESWWGPEGCHVEVHELDLRVGGALFYDMIVENAPEHSHATRGRFAEIVPLQRLKIRTTTRS